MTCAGVLLTGGTSRRLGVDKATIMFRGETLAARAGRTLAAVCDPVVEVGSGVSGLPALREEPPGSGPAAALLAGARALDGDRPVLLLACDLPYVEVPLLRLLAEWPGLPTAIPLAGGEPQYVCARYGPGTRDNVQAMLLSGHRSFRAALAGTECDQVDESIWSAVAPPHSFADVDTPEDLERLRLS